MSYEKQLFYKSLIVKENLIKIAKINIDDVEVVASDKILNYRNTVEPFVKVNKEIKTGFFKKISWNIYYWNYKFKIRSSYRLLNKLLSKLNQYKGTKKEFKEYNDINNWIFKKLV